MQYVFPLWSTGRRGSVVLAKSTCRGACSTERDVVVVVVVDAAKKARKGERGVSIDTNIFGGAAAVGGRRRARASERAISRFPEH